jgi:PAS domain S-box-containing protein
MPQIVWTAHDDGSVDYANQRWYEFTGSQERGGGDQAWMPVLHPDDVQRALDTWYGCVKSGERYQLEYRLRDRTGGFRWHLSRAVPVRDDHGRIVRWFGTSTDIEDLKRAEQALREESRVVETLQGIGVALTQELDLHKLVQVVIDRATQLTGAQHGAFFYTFLVESGHEQTLCVLSPEERPREAPAVAPSLHCRETARCDDVTEDPRFAPNPPHFGWPEDRRLRSYLAVPVVNRSSELLGALFFGHEERGKFGEREERIAAGIAGWASVAIDNARLFEEAKRTARELKKANAAKDEFLGLVSHELKTPITTIYGNAEVLRRRLERLDTESRVAALHDISNEAERLHRIIDNLLVLARLERGQAISAEPLLARRIVERILSEHQHRFPHRTIRMQTDDSVVPIIGEPVYIEQVVRNLLSNAEKYSPRHAPIDVRIIDAGGRLEVSVLDRGRGVSSDEAELIFTPFYRSPASMHEAGGVGIGLAVCKRLIEAQGGTMWARSRPGGGADIGFSLPAAEDLTLDY